MSIASMDSLTEMASINETLSELISSNAELVSSNAALISSNSVLISTNSELVSTNKELAETLSCVSADLLKQTLEMKEELENQVESMKIDQTVNL